MNMPSVMIVGPSAIGKTTAVAQALQPKSTFWLCTEPGALSPMFDPALNHWGSLPRSVELLSPKDPVKEVRSFLPQIAAEHRSGLVNAVVIDTLSSLADREYNYIRLVKGVDESYGRANRAVSLSVCSLLYDLLQIRSLFTVCIAHEKESQTIEGRFTPGGPRLAGDLVRSVPAMFDEVLRVAVENRQRIIKVDPLDRSFLTKDRLGVVTDGEALDLRSIFKRMVARANGKPAQAQSVVVTAVPATQTEQPKAAH